MKDNPLDEHAMELPPNLRNRLREFQRTVWTAKVVEGLLAGLFGLLLAYLLVFALDRVWNTPPGVRALILVAGVSGLGFWFPLKCHRWIWQQRSLEQVARLLKHRYPRLGDQLLGIVELAHHSSGSEALVQAAFRQADEAVKDKHFNHEAIPGGKRGRWTIATLVCVGIVVLCFVLMPSAGRNALARAFMPWLNTERYTFAQIQSVPRQMVVPYGEPFELGIELLENSDWAPDSAKAFFRDQEPVVAALDPKDRSYKFEFQSRREPARLHLHIGDDKRSVQVKPATRPELTSLTAIVNLPDYLRYERDPEVEVLDGSISLVEGSEATFVGRASRELAYVTMDEVNQRTDGDQMFLDPVYVTESTKHNIRWRDDLGLTARQPLELRINSRKDTEPSISAKMTSTEQVILVDDVVTFDLRVNDDFGIRETGLAWVGEKGAGGRLEAPRGLKIAAAGSPETQEIRTEATFSAARERVKPQTIQISAFATDYMPGRPLSYSQPIVLHILSPEEHASWVTGEFGKWFRRAQEVYEREKQLHMTNQELRNLAPEDLDKAENRQRIENQAVSERINGKRLDQLTEDGKELVESAARNEEFEAKDLELWTQMLNQLKGLAQNRMPSVADMLKDASEAPKGEPQDQQVAENDEKGSPSKPGQEEDTKDDRRSANVTENKQQPKGSKGDGEGGSSKQSPGMSMADRESGFMPEVEQKGGEKGSSEGGSSGLGLPGTTLGAVPTEGGQQPQSPSSPQAKMEGAVVEQTGLLDEFERISDELKKLLGSLETSTFVKRLKAASREQLTIASDLNETLPNVFGMAQPQLGKQSEDKAENLALREEDQGDVVHTIQEDMEAYFNRKKEQKYKNVLEQMDEMRAVSGLQDVAQSIRRNLKGRSIAAAEYWADTLDRWAEEMVAAPDGQSGEQGGGDSDTLTPEIVLEVMRILHEEIKLRDETRELEKAKAALEKREFEARAKALAETQKDLRDRTFGTAKKIEGMPMGADRFSKQIQLLTLVAQVMGEAQKILERPDTGPEAVAAETEAIELLMEARRQNPNSGGGGGSSPGGGTGTQGAGSSALSGIGPGAAENATPEERTVKQSTGREERDIPEEFRDGLDSYFNALEREAGS